MILVNLFIRAEITVLRILLYFIFVVILSLLSLRRRFGLFQYPESFHMRLIAFNQMA
jgi:hypothetical protein